MGIIADNIKALREELPENVTVVVVSKTRNPAEILEAYDMGQRIFGENRVQEILSKGPNLPGDIHWHLIGHLQTNKVRQVVPVVSMIESVDSVRLLSLVSKEALKCGKVVDCLLQVHISAEETKSGFSPAELAGENWKTVAESMHGVRICGLMGMASFTEDIVQVRNEFRLLSSLFRTVQKQYFRETPHFREVSMGMSGDWRIAIEEGSTMIRVGTLIFGERIKK